MRSMLVALALASTFACANPPPTGASPLRTRGSDARFWKRPGFSVAAGARIAVLGYDDPSAADVDALALKPEPAGKGEETQAEIEARRLRDFRSLRRLFARDAQPRDPNAVAFENLFTASLMRRKVTVVERREIEALFGEQRLAGDDDPLLSAQERGERQIALLPCDYVVFASGLGNRTDYDVALTPLGIAKCCALVTIPAMLREAEALQRAIERGTIDVMAPEYHSIEAAHFQGATVRALDVRTGELVWIGALLETSRDRAGIGRDQDANAPAFSELVQLQHLCDALADDLLRAK